VNDTMGNTGTCKIKWEEIFPGLMRLLSSLQAGPSGKSFPRAGKKGLNRRVMEETLGQGLSLNSPRAKKKKMGEIGPLHILLRVTHSTTRAHD